MSTETFKKNDFRIWFWLCVLILALAIISRIGGALASYRITDPDAGVVALMAKHMAEGKGWPVFFYGQAYMGNLEPTVSAFWCRVFGLRGFSVNLGTSVFGILVVWVLMRWAKEVAGYRGSFFVGLLCAIGPLPFAWFMVVPRGGYAAAIALGLLAMWWSTRLQTGESRQGSPKNGFGGFVTGVVAGLAWWSNPLLTPSVLASATIILVGLRGRFWRPAFWMFTAGFFVGSAPFWWWNLRHEWQSLSMLRQVGSVGIKAGFARFGTRWLQLLDLTTTPSWYRYTMVFVYGLIAGGTIWGVLALLRRRRAWEQTTATVVSCLLFLVTANYFYLRSGFVRSNTPRYLFPQFPVWALLAGIAYDYLPRRWWVRAPWLLSLALVFISQWNYLRELGQSWAVSRELSQQDAQLKQFLENEKVGAVYCNFRYYGLNFALDERWPFTALTGERIPEIRCRAEQADRIAFLNNHGGVLEAMSLMGFHVHAQTIGAWRVDVPNISVETKWNEVPPDEWADVRDTDDNEIRHQVADRDMDTAWESDTVKTSEPGWYVLLKKPCPIAAVRLCSPSEFISGREAILEVLKGEGLNWEVLYDFHKVPAFHKSGPRLYWCGRRFRMEYSLPGIPIIGIRWRMRKDPAGKISGCRIQELQLFEKTHENYQARENSLGELAQLLKANRVKRVYADRWLSYALLKYGLNIEVEKEFSCADQSDDHFGDPSYVRWQPSTAIIVLEHDAKQTRYVLESTRWGFSEISVPPWVLFVSEDDNNDYEKRPVPVYWTGYSLFHGNRSICASVQEP